MTRSRSITTARTGRSPAFTRSTRTRTTVDDGATYFPDDANKIPPFTKDGKEAVRARVFSCDGGKTKYVAYLERITPKAKAAIDATALRE